MIFNISSPDAKANVDKFIVGMDQQYDTFITDAIHIYGRMFTIPFRSFTNVWLIWKPGDPVECLPRSSGADYIRARTTLCIDPGALVGSTNIYIPYATSIETFNHNWRETSDHSDDNYVYTQECFSDTATIHVNSALRSNMVAHSEIWGDIINNVVADL